MDAGDETRADSAARDGRLEAVAALVPPGSQVADIGTGHGLLAHGLLASGRSPHCIVTERTKLLLRGVRAYPASHPLAGSLELRAGDGLAALRPDDRVDVVVAAGMGGPSILGILERSPLLRRRCSRRPLRRTRCSLTCPLVPDVRPVAQAAERRAPL